MVEFTGHEDPDFAFGQMYGIRSFKIRNGNLGAVTAQYVYHAGENWAVCNKFPTNLLGEILPTMLVKKNGKTYYKNRHGELLSTHWMDPLGRVVNLLTHRIACKWCSCGFYGYYDRFFNDYADGDTVTGIVAAYGRISYSNRGFRASRLKLVAAVNPHLLIADAEKGPVIPP